MVIDTEGKSELKEIAIISSQGQLIYEAFTKEHPDNQLKSFQQKPLKSILREFLALTRNKLLIFHNAIHDLAVIRNSFKQVGLPKVYLQDVQCTYELAKQYFPNYYAYSLEYLAHKLQLKVERQYFNSRQAHTARYDALFTYQLYLKIRNKMTPSKIAPNPFNSSRVDNPFQNHADEQNIYRDRYIILESIIDDIKHDLNHQSKGAVVIGAAGTGKTHLIMRLAKERLENNRLLFIPCPNDAETVKYHTYTAILESLNRQIPGTNYNQLEHLLACSFAKIIRTIKNPSQKIQQFIDNTNKFPLNLYRILGGAGTRAKRENWDYIEKITNKWWLERYSAAGYAPEIIKSIIKFCRYSDLNYKQLVKKWLAANELEPEELEKIGLNSSHKETSKEDFSLEAISVLGKLSLLSEPLIIVFDQLEMLCLEHNRDILFNFGEAIKELFTRVPNSLIILNLFPDRWQKFQQTFDDSIIDRISQYQLILETPTEDEFQQILQSKAGNIDLRSLFTTNELQEIVSNKSSVRAVLNSAADYYRYKYQNIPLLIRYLEPPIPPSADITSDLVGQRLDKIESQYNRLEQLLTSIAKAFNIFANIKDEPESEVTYENSKKIGTSETITLENKVIDYIKNTKTKLEKDYDSAEILIDEKDRGKLRDIIQVFGTITNLETDILPTKRVLPPHIVIVNKKLCIGFLSSANGSSFTSRISNYNEFVATNESVEFVLLRDVRSDEIRGKIGLNEIAKLNNSKNGRFIEMERENRLTFELIYQLISDIYNQDLIINLETEFEPSLHIISSFLKEYWLIKALF